MWRLEVQHTLLECGGSTQHTGKHAWAARGVA